MVSSVAADLTRTRTTACTASNSPPDTQGTKNCTMRNFNLVFRAYFLTPTAPAKFNPVVAMKNLFQVMLKDEPSLILHNSANNKQIKLTSAMIPNGKTEFKKFFKVSTTHIKKQQQTHVCIGCHVLSNRTLGQIKFRSHNGNLLAYLKLAYLHWIWQPGYWATGNHRPLYKNWSNSHSPCKLLRLSRKPTPASGNRRHNGCQTGPTPQVGPAGSHDEWRRLYSDSSGFWSLPHVSNSWLSAVAGYNGRDRNKMCITRR